MSHSINLINNKYKKLPKVNSQQYILSKNEPVDNFIDDIITNQSMKPRQKINNYYMIVRRKIRRDAQKLRFHTS